MSTAPAAVEATTSIERGDLPSEAVTALRAFARGFTDFLRGFARAAGGLLARGLTVAAALVATASYFCDFRLFLRCSAAAALDCLSCSF